MTLEKWAPVYRDDEANERFTGQRYGARPPHRRRSRYVVCGQCMNEDAEPYLRRNWLIGWIAICPRHHCLLSTRCNVCDRKLLAETRMFVVPRLVGSCGACGSDLRQKPSEAVPANPTVLRLQESLLKGKRDGFAELPGIGRLSWQEVIALTDIVLGTFWTRSIPDIFAHSAFLHTVLQYFECSSDDEKYASTRYRSLLFLAWMLEGWPDSANAQVAKGLLTQWATAPRTRVSRHLGDKWEDAWDPGPHQIEPHIQQQIRQRFDLPAPAPFIDPD